MQRIMYLICGTLLIFYEIFEVRERYDFSCSRTISELTKQIRMGWMGGTWEDEDLGTRTHKPVDAALCKKFFDHASGELDKWIKNSGPPGSAYHPVGYSGLRSNLFVNISIKEILLYL